MAAVSWSPAALRFLSLPAEIRVEIYQRLFEAAHIAIGPLVSLLPQRRRIICSDEFQRHILATCSTIRNEAHSYLVAATTLEIAQPLDAAIAIPPYYLDGIRRLVVSDAKAFTRPPFRFHASLLPSLQVLELRNIVIWCRYHEETYLESDQGNDTMYTLAMFNLNRISGSLSCMVGNPERTFKIRLSCQFVVSSVTHDTIHALIDVDSRAVMHKSRGPKARERNAWAGFY